MSIGSPGSNPTPPPPAELPTAQTIYYSQQLGMMQDTTAVSFTQLPSGKIETQGNPSNPSRPVLASPGSVRVSTASDETTLEHTQVLEELINGLPDNVRIPLQLQSRLPSDQQNPSLAVLNNVLTTSAIALSQLNNYAQMTPSDSPLSADRSLITAQQSLFTDGSAIYEAVANCLTTRD